MKKVILNVGGMSCSHCVNAVTQAVTSLEGVLGVHVELENKKVAVEFDDAAVSLEAIREAIEEEGYDVL